MQTIIVVLILIIAAVFLIRRLIRTLREKDGGGCDCGCDGCDTARRNRD